MLSHSILLLAAVASVAVSQTLLVTNSESPEAATGGKIIRPNITITSSQRRVFVPKGKSLKFGDSPILKLSFQPSAKFSKALSFSEPKSSQFFHLVPSTPTPSKAETTSLAPAEPGSVHGMRSVHRLSNTTYQMPADFLCEGLDCPKGQQCSLAQPTCTPVDCSLKPSCAKKLSDHCVKCRPPCVHAILNLDAPGGCHPCLCEVTVFRPSPNLVKKLAAISTN